MDNKTKGRLWAFIGYPESLPADWIDLLISTGCPFAVSPLHEFDLDSNNKPKKPHYHVILVWDGPTTYAHVCGIVCDKLGQPAPIKLECVRGYFRYFCHLDNPDKAPYNVADIRVFNGFDVDDISSPSQNEEDDICMELIALCKSHDFFSVRELFDFLIDTQSRSLFRFARKNVFMIREYLYGRK